jgi:hypothetical protein
MSARLPLKLAALLVLALGAAPAGGAAPGAALRLQALSLRPGDGVLGARGEGAGDDLCLLQFEPVPGRAEREALSAAGAEILAYLPDNGYLLRAAGAARGRLAGIAGVIQLVDYRPEWRLAPALREAAGRGEALALTLSFAPGTPLALRADQALALGAELLDASPRAGRPRLWLRAPAALLPALSALPDLLWVSPVLPLSDRNDDSSWIVQSATPSQRSIWNRGLHGEGQILGHIDSNLSPEVCFLADPEGDPAGPAHRKLAFIGALPGWGSNHGTHTAGTLAGDAAPVDAQMDTLRRGGAWAARLAHSNYVQSGVYDLYTDLLLHHEAGARIHTNSWGQDNVTSYTELCVDIDAFSHDHEEAMIAWAVTNQGVLYTPENAKSTLAVAASYTNDEFSGGFHGWDQHYSGGLGPTADGRRKPELHAPGYGISSANRAVPCGTTSSSGTSMACPAVAAAGALARQYLTAGWWPSGAPVAADAFTPSGALLRALLINSTLPMDSLPAGYPNDLEGWGRLRLDEALYLAGESRELWLAEKRNAEGLETGELFVYRIEVESAAEPLAVTLAFTDPPGAALAAEPVVNDLDLEVLSPTELYRGNVFDEQLGESLPGGAADPLNTVERVLVSAPTPGSWEIRVRARRAAMGPQGYGLVVNGDLGASVFAYLYDQRYLSLANSFPSPFLPAMGARAAVTLRFELRADQRADLSIYDVAGRRVRSLALGEDFTAGTNERAWDGRDDAGEPAASGIYFARLETERGDRSRAARIVLIR